MLPLLPRPAIVPVVVAATLLASTPVRPGALHPPGLDAAPRPVAPAPAPSEPGLLPGPGFRSRLSPGPRPHPHGAVWSGGRLHHLRTTTVVGPGDTLRIEAGATVVASPGAGLVVERGGVLEAVGTASRPVVLTCDIPGPTPGCWDGLVLRGRAPINHGSATSPDGGCLEAGSPDPYGGCDPADSSGRLRFVRIEHGGLRLEGVGSGTEVDGVQVHRSAEDGIAVVGGAVDLRRLYVTGAAGAGLGWSGGWTGRAQHLVLVSDPSGYEAGIAGTAAPGPPSLDSSDGPTVSHATVLAPLRPGSSGPDAPAIRLAGGAGGRLANLVLVRPGVALDLDDDATCAALDGGILRMEGMLVAGPSWLGSPDPDPPSCGGGDPRQAEGDRLAAGAAEILVDGAAVDRLLLAPPSSPAVDLRPSPGSAAAGGAVSIPADGFFEPGLEHRGGVGPGIPWYLGWARSTGLTMPDPYAGFRAVGGEVLLDLELDEGTVVGASVVRRTAAAATGVAGSSAGARSEGHGGPARSVVGTVEWEALPVAGSLTRSEVGEVVPGMVRVSFDLRLRNLLSFADFVTVESGFPATPDTLDALFLLPFEETLVAGSGGAAVEIPAGDLVRPSTDWDGAPFNFLPGGACVAPGDCLRWEPFASPLAASDSSAARTVGYDLDPAVQSFRVRLLIAADLRDAAP